VFSREKEKEERNKESKNGTCKIEYDDPNDDQEYDA